MTKYMDVIYGYMNYSYVYKLCKYIQDRYNLQPNMKLLDIGCGSCIHLRMFRLLGLDAYGVDKRIEIDDEKVKKCNIENEKLPFKDNSFDVIFSKSLLEHVQDPDNFIKESYRVLRKNGIIIILVPDWKSQLKHYWDDYTHCKAWTYKGLKDCLIINNFRNVECEYFYQLPFVWKHSYIGKIVTKIVSILPDSLKWKDKDMRNGKDRKLIRFSKELMLLASGYK